MVSDLAEIGTLHFLSPLQLRGNSPRLENGASHGYHQSRRPPGDRPKSKHVIPGCVPWVLVKTKLGRRFVYNPDENKSLWTFPPDVMRCVIEYDRLQREGRERKERGEVSDQGEDLPGDHDETERAMQTAEPMPPIVVMNGGRHDESDEYEEVEVTDDEIEGSLSKRQKLEGEEGDAPLEFNEDDMVYQLAAMGQDYGLDPGEFGDGQDDEWEEGAEGLPLTEEDSTALFKDLLDDFRIDPFAPWESIVEGGKIIDDERYTCLPNMKSRKDVWSEWSRERIQQLKEQKERQEKKDPRIPYFAFLQQYATPKLYWPEFRRKYKKEPEMRDSKVADKDREKWYREHINRKLRLTPEKSSPLTFKGLKLPESTLKSDLTALLKSLPLYELNRSTSLEALPSALRTDVRYISLRTSIRDPLIEAFIAISPPAPEKSDMTAEEAAELSKRKMERERREQALTERARQVQGEKRRHEGALRHSKDALHEGEVEIQRAMRVGREGLLSHMDVAEKASGS